MKIGTKVYSHNDKPIPASRVTQSHACLSLLSLAACRTHKLLVVYVHSQKWAVSSQQSAWHDSRTMSKCKITAPRENSTKNGAKLCAEVWAWGFYLIRYNSNTSTHRSGDNYNVVCLIPWSWRLWKNIL